MKAKIKKIIKYKVKLIASVVHYSVLAQCTLLLVLEDWYNPTTGGCLAAEDC